MMRTLAVALILLSSVVALANDDEPLTYLFQIPIEKQSANVNLMTERLQATLHLADTQTAQSAIEEGGALRVIERTPEELRIEITQFATMSAPPEARHLTESFVIDYDEAAVQTIVASIGLQHDNRPSIDELAQFVFDFIENKNYVGTFELASKVAETRSGDCTEHAILLTALARAFNYPARFVTGILIYESNSELAAYGHAWAEIHDSDEWQLSDATVPANMEDAPTLFYLPFSDLRNEGPGYGMDLVRNFSLSPRKISALAPAAQTTSTTTQ